MILKITNNCDMGCTHCFHNCLPNGEHMIVFRQRSLKNITEVIVNFVMG